MNKYLSPIVFFITLACSVWAREAVVVFNEIHYHPSAQHDSGEWVELHNQMALDVDMSGWKLSAGIDFDFPEGTVLAAGEYLVVAQDPAKLQALTGYTNALGPYTGKLANGGETIRLRNNKGSFRTFPEPVPPPAPDTLWSVDFQGDGNGGAFGQLAPPLPMTGIEAAAGFGNVWNAFTLRGHNQTSTDPSLNLVNSTGAVSGVTLSLNGTVTGWSQNGNALINDYLFVNAGNSDPDVDWTITGLLPGTNYAVFAYGGIGRDINLLIDLDGDGSLANETATLAAGGGRLISPITASPSGSIAGRALPGTVGEGNWGGFQIFPAPTTQTSEPAPGAGKGSGPRRIMDEISYNDRGRWPVGPDGSGTTLAKVHPLGKNDAENWASSALVLGTPGAANLVVPEQRLRLNEFTSSTAAVFRLELYNDQAQPVVSSNVIIRSEGVVDAMVTVSNLSVAAQGFLTFDETQLGFRPADGDRLFLSDGTGSNHFDAAVVDVLPRARVPDGSGAWHRQAPETFNAANTILLETNVVINEIMYLGFPTQVPVFEEADEEWIEIYNQGDAPVDLSNWSLNEGIEYNFEPGTLLAAGDFLVVAEDTAAMSNKYFGITVVGNYDGRLSNGGELLQLRDANQNVVDEVVYADEGRWPAEPDGGGASLELVDTRSDNAIPEAWAASLSGTNVPWQTITYRDIAENDGIGNNVFHEFLLGLLDAGEVLIDDVVVIEDPDGTAVPFIQNGTFENDTLGTAPAAWRVLGTHRHASVIIDPLDPGNQCLHLKATGRTEDKHNKLETTHANGQQVNVGTTYEISFRAKWISGSNLLNSRLYFNYLQRTHRLIVSDHWGTPGRENSMAATNRGPLFSNLQHTPVMPAAGESVTVRVEAFDPDGLVGCTLFYRQGNSAFSSIAMTVVDGQWTAQIPGHPANALVQFYVEGTDAQGAQAFFPAGGSESRALLAVGSPGATGARQHLRILINSDDRANLFDITQRMSNDRIGATVIYNNTEVYYDVRAKLKASAFGRFNNAHYGFNIAFDPSHPFRGIHSGIAIERGGSSQLSKILFASHSLSRAGGGNWSTYPDVANVTHPTPSADATTDLSLISMARHSGDFFDGQFDEDGTLFNHEVLYNPNGTIDGNPESLKRNNPYNHTNGRYDFKDWQGDKEGPRWGFQIRSNRLKDDYSGLLALGAALGNLSGDELYHAMEQIVDVDQFARSYAMFALIGNDDGYTRIFEHNWRMYQRPTDGRLIALPWDLDRCFQLSTSAPLVGGNELARFLNLPQVNRRMHGHVLDIVRTTFNQAYLADWADHYQVITGINFASLVSYTGARGSFLSGGVPTHIPLQLTTPAGGNLTTTNEVITLEGRGWVDIQTFNIIGLDKDPVLEWLDDEQWRLSFPLTHGLHNLTLETKDHQGNPLELLPVSITNLSRNGIDFATSKISQGEDTLSWNAAPGVSYVVEQTSDIPAILWSVYTTTNGQGRISVPIDASQAARKYYRLRWE